MEGSGKDTVLHKAMGYEGSMRGDDERQEVVFSYLNTEQRIPADHPLRGIRELLENSLREMSLHFDALYAQRGRPSIAPERLLRALLLMVLYSIRSERQLMEQINYNLLYRWFVGLNPDDEVWDVTVFTKNRERLMRGEVSGRLLDSVVEQARGRGLLSEEHFTVDGTLIQVWANPRSFRPKDPPPARGSEGGKPCLRDTHESTSDPEARLFKRSRWVAALPSYLGHVLTENRHGLVVAACATQSSTRAEREAGLRMVDGLKRAGPMTLGADNAYQGWGKQARPVKQMKLRGVRRVDWLFRLVMAAHNLLRLQKLIPAQ